MTNLANSLQVFHSSGLEHCKAAVNMVQSMQEMANLCGNTSASSVGTPLHKVLLVKQAPPFSPSFSLSFSFFALSHTPHSRTHSLTYILNHLSIFSIIIFPSNLKLYCSSQIIVNASQLQLNLSQLPSHFCSSCSIISATTINYEH